MIPSPPDSPRMIKFDPLLPNEEKDNDEKDPSKEFYAINSDKSKQLVTC